MNTKRRGVLVAVILGAGLIAGAGTLSAQQASQPLSAAQIAQILGSQDRTAADRTNDLRRKPELMLAFIGIRPGIVALDLSAAGGYTTELLARAVGPSGIVYGQSRRPTPAVRPRLRLLRKKLLVRDCRPTEFSCLSLNTCPTRNIDYPDRARPL